MKLSLTKEHYITVLDDKGSVRQLSVVEAVGQRTVVDWYGKVHTVTVSRSKAPESAYMLAASSGEPMVFGENHTFLIRFPNTGEWVRKSVAELTEPVYVQLPQRKIKVSPDLFDVFDLDDRGIFLAPVKATDMLTLMRKAAWCGVTVARQKSELRIDLDRRRPSCFAAKLINGGFDYDINKTLGGLVGAGIVMPSKMYTKEYLNDVKRTGILMEGSSVLNNVPLLPPKRLEKPVDVYHIELDDVLTPIELAWCHS